MGVFRQFLFWHLPRTKEEWFLKWYAYTLVTVYDWCVSETMTSTLSWQWQRFTSLQCVLETDVKSILINWLPDGIYNLTMSQNIKCDKFWKILAHSVERPKRKSSKEVEKCVHLYIYAQQIASKMGAWSRMPLGGIPWGKTLRDHEH